MQTTQKWDTPTGKHPGGRPTKYDPAMITLIDAASFPGGATMSDFAQLLEVDIKTLYRWIESEPEFCQALARARDRADAVIEGSLFARARGYEHPEDKIFLGRDGNPVIVPTIKHYPPDTPAAQFWLTNRQRDRWANRTETEITGNVTLTAIPTDQLISELSDLRRRNEEVIDVTPETKQIEDKQ